MSLVDIHTIGAGGGSWPGSRRGPSRRAAVAGADPGLPVTAAVQPTVTDANLFLGRLDPGYFLGGRIAGRGGGAERPARDRPRGRPRRRRVRRGRARDHQREDGRRDADDHGQQGIDPREYSLVAFGGAGPMHAVWLAEELEIRRGDRAWSPGTFSAWGMLQTDMRHDVVRAFYRPIAELEAADVAAVFAQLEEEDPRSSSTRA